LAKVGETLQFHMAILAKMVTIRRNARLKLLWFWQNDCRRHHCQRAVSRYKFQGVSSKYSYLNPFCSNNGNGLLLQCLLQNSYQLTVNS